MTEPTSSPQSNKILRATIWVAIGALIAAALVCVVWVLIGDSNGIVGKAFLTILLLAGFAGVAIAESNMAQNRPTWLALTSMISWVLILLVGAFLIWMPTSGYFGVGAGRVFKFIVIALIIQGALLHARLFLKAFQRHQTTFTSIVTYVTIGLVVILMVMLVLPLMTDEFVTYRPLYWRVVVALAILSAVGTALLPLVNALFAPKRPRPHLAAPYGAAPYGAAPYGAAPYGAAPYGSAPLPVAAPDPHSSTRSCAVATPQRSAADSSGSSSPAHGHDSGPWKMSPAVMPSDPSRSVVVRASMHGEPSGATALTVALTRISAPARRAAFSSAPLTRPMPPTGTSQSPVPPPIT